MVQKVQKRGKSKGVANRKLSTIQKEILDLILSENLTPLQIADRRKTSERAVYKTINILKRKGFITKELLKGSKKSYPLALKKNGKDLNLSRYIRLHGVELNIEPYYFSNFYHKMKHNTMFLEGWTIRIYEKTLEAYMPHDMDFKGITVQQAFSKFQQYFNRLIKKIENRLKIGIIKNDKCNISFVNMHIAEVNNEVARELDKDKIKITVYGKDGYAWFKIDTSWNFNEAEAIHPKMSKQDAELVFERHLNDWRDHNPMTNSELQGAISEIVKIQRTEAEKWSFYAENIQTHTKAIQELSHYIEQLTPPLERIKRKIKSTNDILKLQDEIKSLTEKDRLLLSEWLFDKKGL